ncbi:hypothetical protein JDW15_04470 [Aerococcaceae bacterium zg-ZJ1578]|uniref:hypothetical protein n=1 Tax=Aerococcaceae bacterium zg-252 TaxID=2796928 RepID=UPI001A197CB7|nr:hypothetical protein [Aerococcaceae bacterium zg-1578]
MAQHVLTNIAKKYRPGQMIVTLIETGEVIDLTEYKIYLSTKPSMPNGARNIKIIQTTGRTGFLPLDLKTTKPIEFSIELSSLHHNYEQREQSRSILEHIEGRMAKIEFYSEPYSCYEGFITGVEVTNTRRLSTQIKATVHAQPYRLFNHTLGKEVNLSNGDEFVIPKGYVKPKLILTGSGDISITHNDVKMDFKAVPANTPIVIDCVNKQIFHQHSKNVRTNYGHLKRNKSYIDLVGGKSISWTGNVSRLVCIFEWRSVD